MSRERSRGRPERPRSPDIELTASVEADELRFTEPPDTEVKFSGEPDYEAASGSDRENLPERVDADVTYRDVRVDYRLATRVKQRPPDEGRQQTRRDS